MGFIPYFLTSIFSRLLGLVRLSPYIAITLVVIVGAIYDPKRNIFGLTVVWATAMVGIFVALKLLGVLLHFVPFFIVILVVLFQPEIRRVAAWLLDSTEASSETPSTPPTTDQPNTHVSTNPQVIEKLVDIIFELARRKFGALVVLEGEEPIAEHGVTIGAELSQGLLCSIFHPDSSLNGGIVVRRGRVASSLSLQLRSEGSQLNPRHNRAVDLSTKYPGSTVVTVSEGFGEVQIYREGVVEVGLNMDSLKSRLLESMQDGSVEDELEELD